MTATDVIQNQPITTPGAVGLLDPPSILHHFARTTDVMRSIVEGVKIVGLCGERFRVRSSPETAGTTSRAPRVCPACATRFTALPKHPR